MWTSQKSLLKKIPKTRVGKPTIGFQTLVNRLNKVSSAAFRGELEKIALGNSIEKQIERDRATEAIRTVREGGPSRHLEAATVSGALGPGIMLTSRSIKALADAKSGHRVQAVKDMAKGLTRGDFAQSVVGSGLTGAAISVGRGAMGRAHAKRVLKTMGLGKYTEKDAGDIGTVAPPPKPPSTLPTAKPPNTLLKVRPATNPYKTVHQVMKG